MSRSPRKKRPPKDRVAQVRQEVADRATTVSENALGTGFRLGSPISTRDRWTALAVCGFLVLAVGIVFGQTVQHEFVNYDDDVYVYENTHVKSGLTLDNIGWAFTATSAANWHPVTWLSHLLDVQLYGLQPGGHHLTSVALHAAVAVLLFLILWRTTGNLWPSAFVAAVFAIHPLRVESVAWIAERKDVLSGLFFMLTLLAYVAYVRRPSRVRYVTIVVVFAIGLMSKPMLVTLPFVLLLLDYWPLRRIKESTLSRLIIEKIPLFALTIISCAITPLAQTEAVVPLDVAPFDERLGNAVVSYAAYLGKLLLPVDLAVFYPAHATRGGEVVLSLAVLGGICWAAWLGRRKFPYLFVGWFWYLGMLVPVIGLLQVGGQSMADRYTYLPQIGLLIAVAWGVADASRSWRWREWACGAAATATILVLMGCAYQQTTYWRDSAALWTHALECTTKNVPAHLGLGDLLQKQERYPEAVAQYRAAVKASPSTAECHAGLGQALNASGQYDEAISELRRALKIDPDFAQAHSYLSDALAAKGQIDEAIVHLNRVVQLKPDHVEAHSNLGLALASKGRLDEAVEHYKTALKLKPDYAEARSNYGIVLVKQGRIDEGLAELRQALVLAEQQHKTAVAESTRARIQALEAKIRRLGSPPAFSVPGG